MNTENQPIDPDPDLEAGVPTTLSSVPEAIAMMVQVINWVEPRRMACASCSKLFFYPHVPIGAVRGRIAAAVHGREPGVWDAQRAAWYQTPQGMDDGFVSLFCVSCGCYCHWSCTNKTKFWGTRVCPRCSNRLKLMRNEPVNSSGALCPELTRLALGISGRTEVQSAVLAAVPEEKQHVAEEVVEAVFGE